MTVNVTISYRDEDVEVTDEDGKLTWRPLVETYDVAEALPYEGFLILQNEAGVALFIPGDRIKKAFLREVAETGEVVDDPDFEGVELEGLA